MWSHGSERPVQHLLPCPTLSSKFLTRQGRSPHRTGPGSSTEAAGVAVIYIQVGHFANGNLGELDAGRGPFSSLNNIGNSNKCRWPDAAADATVVDLQSGVGRATGYRRGHLEASTELVPLLL